MEQESSVNRERGSAAEHLASEINEGKIGSLAPFVSQDGGGPGPVHVGTAT